MTNIPGDSVMENIYIHIDIYAPGGKIIGFFSKFSSRRHKGYLIIWDAIDTVLIFLIYYIEVST